MNDMLDKQALVLLIALFLSVLVPLPGFARTCTVLAADHQTQAPTEALLLPPGQGLPSVLLLPAGWYQRGREIEIREAGRASRVRLTALLERGFDYERVQTTGA